MPNVRKVRESPTEIHFAHPYRNGWIAVVLGGGGAYLAWTQIAASAGIVRPIAAGFGGLIFLMGLWSAFYRLELTIDLDRGRVRWMRGPVFSIESGRGTLEETIEAVVLKEDIDREGSEEVTDEWEVELRIRGWKYQVEVFESQEEAPAREEAATLADRLGVPLEETRGL